MNQTIYLGFIASLLAGMGTAVGALPILFTTKLEKQWQSILLGIGGGVMLAATIFSLIIPGLEAAISLGYSSKQSALIISIGIILGAGLLWLIHNNFPHENFNQGQEGKITENFQRIWLFVLAITLHNFPEGLAVGVGFGNGEGLPLAMGIGLQNMPEGLVVALALRELEYSVAYAFGVSLLTGLVEPFGGMVGASVVSFGQSFLPWGMAIAAGAMLFVIVDEIIPEIDRESITQEGTLGIMSGFVTMMFLDIAFS
ncbi:MAG: ZIP family metal transporter [Xenococcaceae cyanobacterium MO_167.B27]|nr:ZIP family metal transporter [Xenococcaceae cyanobacterium MO_167.B27]